MQNKYTLFWDEVNNVYQIRTKTDSYAIEFPEAEHKSISTEKNSIVEGVLKLTSAQENITLATLANILKNKNQEHLIFEILRELKAYGQLSLENYIDSIIFDKGLLPQHQKVKAKRIVIIGENDVCESLDDALHYEDLSEVSILHYRDFLCSKAQDKILQEGDFFIIDGHYGNPYFLKLVNDGLMKHKKPWLYIKGRNGMQLKIGPIFLGGESGCYNCLCKRLESNDDQLTCNHTVTEYLLQTPISSASDIFPNYYAALDILAHIAAIEVSKYLTLWSIPETIGAYISFNLMSYTAFTHHLPKIPYCELCKPKRTPTISSWRESVTLS